jgi:menaquinone-dependent protoporphyrinogen IX oxidase
MPSWRSAHNSLLTIQPIAGIIMNGAILFSSNYGSTAEYAGWISEATGLPVFDVDKPGVDPVKFDFMVLGSPIIYHKLMFHKWVRENAAIIKSKPTVLFTVSGAGAGSKLDHWIAKSLPADLSAHVTHFALRGRQTPTDLTWFDRIMLIIGGVMNADRVAGKEELQGFDYMDKASINPIVEMIERLQKSSGSASETPAARK